MTKREVLEDSLRKKLGEQYLKLVKEKGLDPNKPSDVDKISDLRKELSIPEGFKIENANAFIRTKLKSKNTKSLLKVVGPGKTQGKINRALNEFKPFDEVRQDPSKLSGEDLDIYNKKVSLTEEFIESIRDIDPTGEKYPPEMIDRYVDYIRKGKSDIRKEVNTLNKTFPAGSKVSIGHQYPVSKSIDTPANQVPTEPLLQNQQKGNRYSISPEGQKATGNFIDTKKGWTENFVNDFIVWSDRPENGGSGILSQRGLYPELAEQKLNEMSGIDYDNLSQEDKIKASEMIQDETRKLENRNQFDPSQQAKQREWGILSQDQSDQMGKFAEETGFKPKPRFEVTELGRRLGGVGSKLNTADSVAQIIGGNPIGGGVGLLMQQPAFHKQIAKALGKTLAKSGAKLLPGVGMTMGTLEAAGYASQGRLTQSGIASFSALVGEVPGIGDFLSAGADLLNTGIDIATGNMGKVQMEMDDVIEFDGLPVRALKAARKAA